MVLKNFTMLHEGQTIHVRTEHFASVHMIAPTLAERKVTVGYEEEDYLNGNFERVSGFHGFSSSKQLNELLIKGINDRASIRKVVQFAQRHYVEHDVQTQTYDVSGDEVDIGLFCSGEPEHMITDVYEFGRDTRARLVFDMGVTCNYDVSDMTKAGYYIARLVRSLEMSDYHVEVIGACGNCSHSGNRVNYMTLDIKAADDVINFQRLMFMVHPSFFRGVGFSWLARSTDFISYGLGTQALTVHNFNFVQSLFSKNFGDKQVIMVSLKNIIDKMNEVRYRVYDDKRIPMEQRDDEIMRRVDEYLYNDVKMKMEMRC